MPRAKTKKIRKVHPLPKIPPIAEIAPMRRIREIEVGLKTRIVTLVMLILAASLGLFYAEFAPGALLLWLIVIFAGGYAVFEFELFVTKALLVASALVMQFLVVAPVPSLADLAPPYEGEILLTVFGILDALLIYALAKLR